MLGGHPSPGHAEAGALVLPHPAGQPHAPRPLLPSLELCTVRVVSGSQPQNFPTGSWASLIPASKGAAGAGIRYPRGRCWSTLHRKPWGCMSLLGIQAGGV
ncbi:cell adhesion molecule 2 [Platysternon megacephalum]|uniref:Cell adhesion molecule 2 n=1 Tax=Platysternon megacephalum TaxID=55544 RepID=A0A4D9EH05_9SAUR|nr:cell adhesion molecule 2 [Platysternon megacephalum]